MPEGPEIKDSARRLGEKNNYKTIVGVEVTPASRYWKDGGFPGMERFKPMSKIIFGKRGKKVIIHSLADPLQKLIFGYGMEGRIVYESTKHSGVILQLGYIINEDGVDLVVVEEELFFHDSRHMGHVNAVYTQAEYDFVMKDVGPDLLEGEVDYPLFKSIVTKKTRQHMRVCEFVMEQKFMSGIGNYLRAEILYKARISPHQTLGTLTENQMIELYNTIITTIYGSYECSGLTIHTYISPDNTEGTFSIVVYEQDTDPYGNRVETFMDKKKRNVHWVPAVQVWEGNPS